MQILLSTLAALAAGPFALRSSFRLAACLRFFSAHQRQRGAVLTAFCFQ